MDSTMLTILVALMVTTVLVSILVGTVAKLSMKELVTQTAYMITAGLIFFGLVAMLPGAH